MKPLSMPWMALALHLALVPAAASQEAGPARATRSQPTAADVEEQIARFRKLSARAQKKKLAAVRAAIEALDDPYLRSIRAVGALLDAGGRKTVELLTKNAGPGPRGDRSLWRDAAFPVRQEYVFGDVGVMACRLEGGSPGAPAQSSRKKSKKKKQKKPSRKALAEQAKAGREAELRSMLNGFPPDLDVTAAAMLRELDHDRRADSFARLLETWRDGSHSFYRALDRTAGSEQSVFFYDALLADFVRTCVPERSPDSARIRKSNDAAHDALHAAFLAYRQYRGLREAAALTLLLPPDQELPGALARYGQDQPSGYSMRQIVTLLLADADQDVGRVVELIRDSAPPLPDDLWNGYQPLPALYAAFNKRIPSMIERAGDTDRLLAEQTRRRTELRDHVASVAFDALLR